MTIGSKMVSHILLASLACQAVKFALAQQGAYAQCGGEAWTGATTCVSGYTCVYSNAWYSQCIPASSVSTATGTATATSSSATATATSLANANYLFSFGDSYTSTTFNVTTGPLPTPDDPLGNPPYPGYTAVGGTNWVDVLTVEYNTSLLLTWNYAYGGATINASLVTPYEPTVLSLVDQVNSFLATAASKPATAPWTSENALFSIWIGINDIGNSYYESGNRSAFSEVLLANEFALVQQLYDVGARNFLWINVPPIWATPAMIAYGSSAQELEEGVILDFNQRLEAHIAAFKANNTGVNSWLFDSYTAFSTVLASPTTYGFVDNSSYGNTGDFWGNNYHPSSAAQDIFGSEIGALLNKTRW